MPVRKMPQNIEAEMSVLGVAFLQKEERRFAKWVRQQSAVAFERITFP